MADPSPLTELAAQLPPDWKWVALFHAPDGFEREWRAWLGVAVHEETCPSCAGGVSGPTRPPEGSRRSRDEHPDLVAREHGVPGDESHLATERLGDQHAVEWIVVVTRERAGSKGI